MIRFCFFSFFLFSAVFLFPQKTKETVIKGKAGFAAGKEIRLIAFDDLMTYTPVVVATGKIAKDGDFKLTYTTRKIQLVQLAIQTSKAEFLLEPEKTYDFTIDMDPRLFQMLDPDQYGGFLQVFNNHSDTTDLNYKINVFTNELEDFVRVNYPYYVYKKRKECDSISNILKSRFPIRYNPTDFYESYLFYSFANVDKMMFQKYMDSLYRVYFDNEYLLYDNPAYMTFFNSFYDRYLYNSLRISKEALSDHINEKPDYLALFNEVGKDPVLVNEKIRELVIIKNLGQFYGNEEFDNLNIIRLLEFIQKNSKFAEHRTIAGNTIASVLKLRSGSLLPLVSLKAVNGIEVTLDKLKGKWVYIQFFNTYCDDCIREMMIIKELAPLYKDSLAFISVSLDFDAGKFSQFMRNYSKLFTWQFAHFNNQFDWLDELEINSLPDNILLDPAGKLSLRYAPDPSRDLPLFLKRKFREEEVEENYFLSPRPRN